MLQLHLNDLKPLTIITGSSFTGKTDLLKQIAKKIKSYSKYINLDTEVTIETNEGFKLWFRDIFGVDFIQNTKTSYTSKIISLGLSCKKGECLIIENPEIHLHPKAISNMAKFFIFLAKNGVQVILESNSEHIINSVCYEVYKKNFNSSDIVIYYKADQNSNFEKINVGNSGKFVDENGNLRKYPSGFFDANSAELWELL